MNHRNNDVRTLAAGVLLGVALLQGCSSGSGGSEVGDGGGAGPTARAQVLNGGESASFREGSEVLLTGKDSEDADGPLIGWSWEQTAGPAVQLIEVNTTTVGFTAPDVAAETTLSFELTVEDTDRMTSGASVDVAVVPAQDADKFLSLDVRGATRNTFDTFDVIAALAEGASTGNAPKPFTLVADAYLVYPPRSEPNVECPMDLVEFQAGIPSTTASGCLVEHLEDLTPAGGIEGEWPANVTAVVRALGPTPEQIRSEWWNPHFTLRVPRLDAADFNQRFVDAGERNRMLDLFNAHKSWIVLSLELAAPENQESATLIVNDLVSQPIVPQALPSPKTAPPQAKVVENDQAGLPTALLMPLEEVLGSIASRESALSAEVYYRTVDPAATRTTLNDWLQQAGFAPDGGGTLLPEAIAGTGEFAHAVYLNNYDLGFGRDMYARTDDLGNVYSFVVNYASLEGAIRKSFPVVTVVMEYSALNGPTDPGEKFVKFFTYVDDGSGDSRRATSMNFDGRGERFTPGNCVACHGGAKPPGLYDLDYDETCGDPLDAVCYAWPSANGEGIDVANGNLQATFLPWDLDSLFFADTDPAITDAPGRFDGLTLGERLVRDYGDYSRAPQEEQLKKLNQAALATYCDEAEQGCVSAGTRRLVEHWYGGADQNGALINTAFDDSAAPAGWQNGELVPDPADASMTIANPDDAEVLYHDVYAQHCRMCHTNVLEPALRFDTYQKLVTNARVRDLVFREGVMPAARLTMDRFWSPQDQRPLPAGVLAAHLGVPEDEATGPAPLAVIAEAPDTAVRRTPFRLRAHDSLFASSYDWEVSYEPVAELAGSSGVMGYQPTAVGNGTPELAFRPDKPGTYTARLIINDPDPSLPPPEELTATATVAVANYLPLACDVSEAAAPGDPAFTFAFLREVRFAASDSGGDCLSAGLLTITDSPDLPVDYVLSGSFDQNGQLMTGNGGTFTLDAGDPCSVDAPAGCGDDTLTYLPNGSGDSYTETLTYTLTDTDGETSAGTISVVVTADLAATSQGLSNPDDSQAVATAVSEIAVDLSFSISGGALPGAGEARYTVALSGGPVLGTISRNGTPIAAGGSFQTDGGLVSLRYVSNEFETGAENVVLTVSDTGGADDPVSFPFSVLPRAPFTRPAVPDGRQLGAVMDQWALSDGLGKLSCTSGCHADDALMAQPVFDLALTAAQIHEQLVTGTLGGIPKGVRKVVQGDTARRETPEDSVVLCYPSTAAANPCPAGTNPTGAADGHFGSEALPVGSDSYEIIRRWIQEGARLN